MSDFGRRRYCDSNVIFSNKSYFFIYGIKNFIYVINSESEIKISLMKLVLPLKVHFFMEKIGVWTRKKKALIKSLANYILSHFTGYADIYPIATL